MYSLKLHPEVNNDLKKLDSNIKEQVFKKLKQIQQNPEIGLSLGNKNNMNLSSFRKIYLAKKKIRIVYKIENNILSVYVLAFGKRDDMEVYKKARKRLSSM